MVYANGIGPINKPKNRENAKAVLSKADYITLREADSFDELKSLGINGKNVKVTADPALTIVPADGKRADELLKACGADANEKLIGISVRNWKNCRADFMDSVSGALDAICEKYNLVPLFLPLKFPEDIQTSNELASKMTTKGHIITQKLTAKEIVAVTGRCKTILAMRLHSLIYAANTNIPTVAIAYDPKVSGFMNYLGMEDYVPAETLTKEELVASLEKVILNEELIKEKLAQNIKNLDIKARENAELALGLIKEEA